MAPAPKNTSRGDQPPAYGETSSPPQPPQPAYGRDGGYYGYDQGQPTYYQQGIQSPQGTQAYYQPGPQMSYYNQQQGPFPGQGQYYGGGQYPGQGQYPQGQNTVNITKEISGQDMSQVGLPTMEVLDSWRDWQLARLAAAVWTAYCVDLSEREMYHIHY
ncbi:hypothetical protein MKX08_004008 [Trichoderma sp. CBMAI-0020]|nr:hypothetical protein MKX08_004008 [Trichoderma sp. CBMAI-0020]